jgi:hypothetical protein
LFTTGGVIDEEGEGQEVVSLLGTTVITRNYVHGEIKRRLKKGNAWYHSVQNLLFPISNFSS